MVLELTLANYFPFLLANGLLAVFRQWEVLTKNQKEEAKVFLPL